MRTTRTNSRTARRARCRKPKDEPKIPALVPTPSLPDVYALADEIERPVLIQALDARQLPSIESEPVVLAQRPDGPRAVLPSASTFRRILDERGDLSYRLGLRLAWPGKHPALSWLPRVVRRDEQHPPLPKTIDAAEERSEAMRMGFALAVREARDERYLDAGQLAEDAETPRWQLTALEEGRLTPVPYTLILRVARALEMKPSDLVARGEELEVEL
jgi:DNA-binding Xre family transcriptional regulator